MGIFILLYFGCTASLYAQSNSEYYGSIQWKDSFSLSKDNYTFYDAIYQNNQVILKAEGSKNQYQFFISKDSLTIQTTRKKANVNWLWSGYIQDTFNYISLKKNLLDFDQLILSDTNQHENVLLEFRNTFENPAFVQILQMGKVPIVAIMPSGHLFQEARLLIGRIDSTHQIKFDTLTFHSIKNRLLKIEQAEINNQELTFVVKEYYHNKIEKRAYKRNYSYWIIRYNLENGIQTNIPIELKESYYYPKIKFNLKSDQVFGIYGNKPDNKALGLFTIQINSGKSIYQPFEKSFIKQCRKKTSFWRNRYIYGLYPDFSYRTSSADYYFFEQYHLKLVGGSSSKPILNFYYDNILIAHREKDSISLTIKTIPKYQKTYQDEGQFSSYRLINPKDTQLMLLFNGTEKYVSNPYKTMNGNKFSVNYITDLQQSEKILKLKSNKDLPIFTSIILKKSDNTYVVFSMKGQTLWIGNLEF